MGREGASRGIWSDVSCWGCHQHRAGPTKTVVHFVAINRILPTTATSVHVNDGCGKMEGRRKGYGGWGGRGMKAVGAGRKETITSQDGRQHLCVLMNV